MTPRSHAPACPTCATPLRELRGARRDFFCAACHATVTLLDDGQQLVTHWEQLPAAEASPGKG
jgi:LSD1 subclass zinc finger protein